MTCMLCLGNAGDHTVYCISVDMCVHSSWSRVALMVVGEPHQGCFRWFMFPHCIHWVAKYPSIHVQEHYSTQTLHSCGGSTRRWSLTKADKNTKKQRARQRQMQCQMRSHGHKLRDCDTELYWQLDRGQDAGHIKNGSVAERTGDA